jgi:hypothetical protein
VRRVVIVILWGWLAIGTLVFLSQKCSKEQEGALRPIPVAAATRT